MPRNSAGTFTLVPGNPVQSGDVVSSTWANSTLDDVADALTDSLDREGRGGMLAPFRFADGTNLLPGASWVNENTTGFYRFDGGDLRVSVLTQDVMRWQNTGAQVWNSTDSQWENILSGNSVPAFVNAGTAESQTLRWDNTGEQWLATDTLSVSTTTVTVNGTLLSPGAGANSFRAGLNAGATTQGTNAVAVGNSAGQTTQGSGSVAIGVEAGKTSQASQGIAIGQTAGVTGQKQYGVAVGYKAGETNQGLNSIAIGRLAGQNAQANNGIIINASAAVLDDTSNGHIHIASDDGSLDFTTAAGWSMSADLDVTGTVTATGLATSNRVRSTNNGTAATPSFYFSGDPDTGMYRQGADRLGFATGGIGRVFVESDGDLTVTGTVDSDHGVSVGATEIAVPTQAAVSSITTVTQAEYTAIVTPDANTLYVIV